MCVCICVCTYVIVFALNRYRGANYSFFARNVRENVCSAQAQGVCTFMCVTSEMCVRVCSYGYFQRQDVGDGRVCVCVCWAQVSEGGCHT